MALLIFGGEYGNTANRMSAHDDLLEGYAEALDTLATEFMPEQEVWLMKTSTTDNEFEEVLWVEQKRFFEYQAYRQQFRLEIADPDHDLDELMIEVTHVRVDDDVYVIAQADTLQPKGIDVTWKLFCERFTKRGQFASIY